MFALKRTSLGSVLDCVAPCLEESLLSLAKLRLEEVWKSFTEHTKRVDVWLKNDSESCEFLLAETNIYLYTQRAQQNFA